MRTAFRAIGLAVTISASAAWPCFASLGDARDAPSEVEGAQATKPPVPGEVEGARATTPAVLSAEKMERFLLNAKITATIKVSKGVTNARQVRMSDGQLTHDAQVQDVDIAMPIFQVDPKHTEVNFKDSYRYNIAAYRLSVLLGLDNVPMSVEREVDRKPAAVTWWVDNVMMEEGDRLKRVKEKAGNPYGPSPARTVGYVGIMHVFDELIQNRDRNAGNALWTQEWKLWMIDHTRAFRLGKELRDPKSINGCERTLLAKMKELTAPRLVEVMGKTLTREEIDALITRRDAIVKLIEARIAADGEAKVLYTLPSAS